eukprot:EG_transcript_459
MLLDALEQQNGEDDDKEDDIAFTLLGCEEDPEPNLERLNVQALEVTFPRHIVTLTAPYAPAAGQFPLRLEPAESADHLQRQIEDRLRGLAQELVNYCEQVWRHSRVAQQAQLKARSRQPRVSPARARELLQTLFQCLEASTPYVPRINPQEHSTIYGSNMVSPHTPSTIITAEVVTSEVPLLEALCLLISARKERRASEKGKETPKNRVRLRPACPMSVLEETLRFLMKAVEFEPCAEKFAGQRPFATLPFLETVRVDHTGTQVIAELLSAEFALSEEMEEYCTSLLRLDQCHRHLCKLQEYARTWNAFSRQPDFKAAAVDYFELSQQTHEAIVGVHQCLEDEGCLQPALDPGVAAAVTLKSMAGGDLLGPCCPRSTSKDGALAATPYHFVRIARCLALVPSLGDVILSFCALNDALSRRPAPGPDGEAPPGAAATAANAMPAAADAGMDYDDVLGTDLLEYIAEVAQAAARLLVQLMACPQGLILISLHPSASQRLLGSLLPRYGLEEREGGDALGGVSAMRALPALAEERGGCEAYLSLLATALPFHLQALLCVDALLSPEEYDSDLLPILHKISYDTPASTAAVAQVLASVEGMNAFLGALERVGPTSTGAKFLVHILLNCLRSDEGAPLSTLFCKRLSETAAALIRDVEAAAANEPRRLGAALDRHIDIKEMLREIRAWAEPNRVLMDLGIEDFLRYIQAQILDFNSLLVTQTQKNPLTMMIVTRLVSAMTIFTACAKQSPLVCVTALDEFGVTADRKTSMPALIEEMLHIVLRGSLRPRLPMRKACKPDELYDAMQLDEKLSLLLCPVLGLLETVLATLHQANDHNKVWNNIPPTAYRNTGLLEALIKVYVSLAYGAEYNQKTDALALLHAILLHWFRLPPKEQIRRPKPSADAPQSSPTAPGAPAYHWAYSGPHIASTLNDSHDAIMKVLKESPRNHYALLCMLCRLLADVEKAAQQRVRNTDALSDASSAGGDPGPEPPTTPSKEGDQPPSAVDPDVASVDSLSASSMSSVPPYAAENTSLRQRTVRGDSLSSDGSDTPSAWSGSEGSDVRPTHRRPTCLSYRRTEDFLYHNLGNVIVDAIGYSLASGLTEGTAVYVLRMAQLTAPAPDLDERYPERAKLHLSIRQELEEPRRLDHGRRLLQALDSNKVATLPSGCYGVARVEGSAVGDGDVRATDLCSLLHPSVLESFLTDLRQYEDQGVLPDQPRPPQRREGDEDPNRLPGKSWEKMGGKSSNSRPGYDYFRDSFRDRKPNTSRPPSAHVDDFGTVPLTLAQHTGDAHVTSAGFAAFEVKSRMKVKEEGSVVSSHDVSPPPAVSPASNPRLDGPPSQGSAFDPILPHAPAILRPTSPQEGLPRSPASADPLPRPGSPPHGAVPAPEAHRRR